MQPLAADFETAIVTMRRADYRDEALGRSEAPMRKFMSHYVREKM